MTASLYQSARSVEDSSLSAAATCWSSLSSDNTEDMRRKGLRIELHEVAPARPGVAAAAQQVLQVVGLALAPREVDPARLQVARVEVDGDEDQVFAFLLRVDEQLVVVGGMELQAPVALQRRVLPADVVEAPDERGEAVGPARVPALDLVLLRT